MAMMGEASAPIEMIRRFAGRRATPADLDAMAKACGGLLRDHGAGPSLEQRLRLPTTAAKWRAASRDLWISEAARHAPQAAGPTAFCRALHRDWEQFITRGPWRQWRDELEPPTDASQFSRALFHATRENDGESLCAKQLGRVLAGQILVEKCPAVVTKMAT